LAKETRVLWPTGRTLVPLMVSSLIAKVHDVINHTFVKNHQVNTGSGIMGIRIAAGMAERDMKMSMNLRNIQISEIYQNVNRVLLGIKRRCLGLWISSVHSNFVI
jgi:hypothetical protein